MSDHLTPGQLAQIRTATDFGQRIAPHEARALLATVDAQAERLASAGAALNQVMDERDHAEDYADKLAYSIAPVEVIGEHSNGNNPWQNALDRIQS